MVSMILDSKFLRLFIINTCLTLEISPLSFCPYEMLEIGNFQFETPENLKNIYLILFHLYKILIRALLTTSSKLMILFLTEFTFK